MGIIGGAANQAFIQFKPGIFGFIHIIDDFAYLGKSLGSDTITGKKEKFAISHVESCFFNPEALASQAYNLGLA